MVDPLAMSTAEQKERRHMPSPAFNEFPSL
jgi:hypothetical protein